MKEEEKKQRSDDHTDDKKEGSPLDETQLLIRNNDESAVEDGVGHNYSWLSCFCYCLLIIIPIMWISENSKNDDTDDIGNDENMAPLIWLCADVIIACFAFYCYRRIGAETRANANAAFSTSQRALNNNPALSEGDDSSDLKNETIASRSV